MYQHSPSPSPISSNGNNVHSSESNGPPLRARIRVDCALLDEPLTSCEPSVRGNLQMIPHFSEMLDLPAPVSLFLLSFSFF